MDRELIELVRCFVEAVLFLLLPRKCPYYPDTREIAAGSRKDVVELALHLHEPRDRLHHDDIDHDRDHRRRHKSDQSKPYIDRK